MDTVLIGCEKSQVVLNAFINAGYNAYSCDILPTTGKYKSLHLQMDVLKAIKLVKPRLAIFHPPCTRLSNSGWWYIVKHNLYSEVKEAANFFNSLLNSDIEFICTENPIQNKEAKKYIRKQDQIIQPYNFGDNASKATCLWLKNLPQLISTGIAEFKNYRCTCGNVFPVEYGKYGCCEKVAKPLWGNQTKSGQNNLPPSKNRAELRSIFFPGIAEAMADQWGKFISK